MKARRKLAYLLPLVFAPLSACAMVLGIEDRELVASSGVTCDKYCEMAMANCTADFALYASTESCLGTCAELDLGNIGDQNVDTVGCRLRNAELAAQTGEKSVYCVSAGPGGNASCGDDCNAYCKLMLAICPGEFTTEMACMTQCAAVPDNGDYNIKVPPENSIECRLYHLSAATIDSLHCKHASGVEVCLAP